MKPTTVPSPGQTGQLPQPHLPGILDRVAARYRLGSPIDWRLITTGYGDTNLAATTSHGKYIVKVFAAREGSTLPDRTTSLIEDAIRLGVRHPRLHRDPTGVALANDPPTGCHMLVMDAIDGADFYTPSPRTPSPVELAAVADQAALITRISKPIDPVDNPWALPNLQSLAAQLMPHLDDEQRHLVTLAVRAYRAVEHEVLPTGWIHNDLTKGNVLTEPGGNVWIIDFGCADYYPRIQELAVAAANLTHGDPRPLLDRAHAIAGLYTNRIRLTTNEWRALPAYTAAAAAMELLGALRARHIDGDDRPETSYLVDLGLAGLRDCLPEP